jgi:hypothetical protein
MTISKRDFMIGAAVAGGGLLLGRADGAAQTQRRVIDAHTHWYPAEWVELVQKEGEAAGARLGRTERGAITFSAAGIGAAFSPNYIDLDSRIKSMDETGIDTQVLSLMAPMAIGRRPRSGSGLRSSTTPAQRRIAASRALLRPRHVADGGAEARAGGTRTRGQAPGLRGVMMATAVMGKNPTRKRSS